MLTIGWPHYRRSCLFALLFVVAGVSRFAHAVPLKSLLQGNSLVVGSVNFSDWQLVSVDATSAVAPDLSLIEVNPLPFDPLNPGLEWIANRQLTTTGQNSIDMTIRFRASGLGGRSITGTSQSLAEFAFGGNSGNMFISDAITDLQEVDLGADVTFASPELASVQSALSFADQSALVVEKNILVAGLDQSVSLSAFTQHFSVVPEPTAGWWFAGLLGSWFCLRRESMLRRTTSH